MPGANDDPIVRLRSAAIILCREAVLLHRGLDDEFWSLPGGGVEPGERSDQALHREIGEELGIRDARIVRLVWVAENRFAHGGRRFHEVGFYWLIDVLEDLSLFDAGEFVAVEPRLRFRWFGLSDVMAADVKPGFLRQGLAALPAATTFVQTDG